MTTSAHFDLIISSRTAPAPHVSRRDVALHGARREAYESNDPARIAARRRLDRARIARLAAGRVRCGWACEPKIGTVCNACGANIGHAVSHTRPATAIEQAETAARMTADLRRAFPAFAEAE